MTTPDKTRLVDVLVGEDRPPWVEPTHSNYAGITSYYLRHRGRPIDADALELLDQGPRGFVVSPCCLFILLAFGTLIRAGTGEDPLSFDVGLDWRSGIAAMWLSYAAFRYWLYRRAARRLSVLVEHVSKQTGG